MPGRNRDAVELRSVAPLIVSATRELVGAIMLVTNGPLTLGVTSAELLRPFDGVPLAIVTKLDGTSMVPVASWGMGRYSGIALVELAASLPETSDLTPLPIGAVCASVDTRGAPSGVATIAAAGGTFVRELIAVYVDHIDTGGGMSDDVITRLASPLDAADAGKPIDGAMLFSWFPPDPVLGRKSEVLAVAMAYPYRAKAFQPRPVAAIAELIGLDDLGRALISSAPMTERPELRQVTGEIVDARPVGAGTGESTPKLER